MQTDRKYLLERVGEAAVAQLYADGFEGLPLDQKILIWHLYRAALAGRDIYYDQRYAHNLEMRDVLEEIITHADGIDAETLAAIERYTKLFWINVGPYNNLTARKFCPEVLARGVCGGRGAGRQERRQYRGRHRRTGSVPMFFDLARRSRSSPTRRRAAARTSSQSSANNFYVGVSMQDLEGFDEKYPLNSRLVKGDGGLVEEVYRVGGKYDKEIREIIGHLEAAVPLRDADDGRGVAGADQVLRNR